MGKKVDVVVIGTGPAGFYAGLNLAEQGKKVFTVDKDPLGGTCLMRGCVPTTCFLAGIDVLRGFSKINTFGLSSSEYEFRHEFLKNRVGSIVKGRQDRERNIFEEKGMGFMEGHAVIETPNRVKVSGKDGEELVLSTDFIAITTGCRPEELEGFEFGRNIIDAYQALNLEKVPVNLCIIGGDSVACVLAHIFNAMGSNVVLVNPSTHLLEGFDLDVCEALETSFRERGVEIHCDTVAVSYEDREEDIRVRLSSGAEVVCEKLIVDIGWKNYVEDLGLEDAGIKLDGNGVMVDRFLRTSVSNIYAAGDIVNTDVIRGPMLASKALLDGFIVAENIMGREIPVDYSGIPSCVWTQPQVGCVGLNEEEARASGEVEAVSVPFSNNVLGEARGSVEGFLKIIANRQTDKIVGVHIIGAEALHLIPYAALALKQGLTVQEWIESALMNPHPSFFDNYHYVLRSLYRSFCT